VAGLESLRSAPRFQANDMGQMGGIRLEAVSLVKKCFSLVLPLHNVFRLPRPAAGMSAVGASVLGEHKVWLPEHTST
jgi:hypothetical protein